MAKKKASTKATTAASASTAKALAASPPTSVVFPELSHKEELECRTILEDQILVIDVRAFSRYGH
jgi:hypothetical protein